MASGPGKHRVEHLVLAQADIGEKLRLHQDHRLHAHHFEHRQQRDDRGVARLAGVEEFEQRDGIVGRDQPLPQPVHHLRDGNAFMAQLEFRNFLAALEDLLKRLDQIDERHGHLPLDGVAGIKAAVRMRPDVIFDLLLLIEKLRGVLELLVLEQAVDKLAARVLLFLGAPADRPAAASST